MLTIDKSLIVTAIVSAAIGFVVTRYISSSAPAESTTEKSTLQEHKDKDTHTTTKTTTTKEPSGETKTVTETDTVTSTKTDLSRDKSTSQTSTPAKRSTVSLSALAGIDITTRLPTYGASVSKEFIGPITIGAWGLTNGSVGVSIGLNF